MTRIHDDRACLLGEGPFWHPERDQLFWFDILNNALLSREGQRPRQWDFEEPASAAGWVDRDTLLVATASGLWRLDLETDRRERLATLEADIAHTRSNDGRADPHGGFWIGTMHRDGEDGFGTLYRFHRGEVKPMFRPLGIPNSICFAPDGRRAYFSCTLTGKIQTVSLDPDGWPDADPEVLIDLSPEDRNPDGAVTDAEGNLWVAEWGGGRVTCFDPGGRFLRDLRLPASLTTCPAFGGKDYATLFCTSATVELDDAGRKAEPDAGKTFAISSGTRGRPEPRVIL